MDGGTHNDPFNNLNLPTPFPDALQEFKVETSSLPARYGHHAASAVNLVTKSGTNAFRGNAFEFIRDYHFNARNFFAPTRDSLKRNQFGGTLGGPVLKDRLFFFAGYQGQRREEQSAGDRQLRADREDAGGRLHRGGGRGLHAAHARRPRPASSTTRIDPAAFSPIALGFLEHVPVSTDPCGRLQYGIPNNNTEHQTLGRADYTLVAEPDACSAATSTRSTTTRRPTTARTR